VSFFISGVLVAALLAAVPWRDALQLFRQSRNPAYLLPFLGCALVMLAIHALRWWWLMQRRLDYRNALFASLISIGGNMVLPFRGGDLLRIHFSYRVSGKSVSEVVSRIVLEKILDLVTISLIGFGVVQLFFSAGKPGGGAAALETTGGVVLVLIVVCAVALGRYTPQCVALLMKASAFLRLRESSATRIRAFFDDLGSVLSVRTLALPAALSLLLWPAVYPFYYLAAAGFCGIPLGYSEVLVVIFGAAIGLMIPAAPSGIGTYHASVVSAFVLVGRSSAEGLLLATVVHILSFIVYAVPAVLLYLLYRPEFGETGA
jgi:uncharacterized protein (TIRG00374 family)